MKMQKYQNTKIQKTHRRDMYNVKHKKYTLVSLFLNSRWKLFINVIVGHCLAKRELYSDCNFKLSNTSLKKKQVSRRESPSKIVLDNFPPLELHLSAPASETKLLHQLQRHQLHYI